MAGKGCTDGCRCKRHGLNPTWLSCQLKHGKLWRKCPDSCTCGRHNNPKLLGRPKHKDDGCAYCIQRRERWGKMRNHGAWNKGLTKNDPRVQRIADKLSCGPRRSDGPYWNVRFLGSRWVAEHRFIWTVHNGPIPWGMVIHHEDGDGHNNKIGNLEMMTRGEHCKLHKPNGGVG